MDNTIFIKGNVPSSKNSKINTSKGSFNSKTVTKYLRSLGIKHYSVSKKEVEGYVRSPNIFATFREEFLKQCEGKDKPLKVGFHFIRGTHHKVDFHNLVQILADLMVAHKFIEDDNMEEFVPFPLEIDGAYHSYNKITPGVIIKIL